MGKHFDYRQTLLSSVDDFLAQTSERVNKAHQTVKEAEASLTRWTLDDLIWVPYFTALTDSVCFENRNYLLETRTKLLSDLPDIYRTYVRYDFRPYFSPAEHELYMLLVELVQVLRRFRHPHTPDSVSRYREMYARYREMCTRVEDVSSQTPAPKQFGEETIYHFILREIVTVLTHIDIWDSQVRRGYLVPDAPLTEIYDGDERPDAAGDISWADKALQAVTGNEWLLVTHQITPQVIVVSLH